MTRIALLAAVMAVATSCNDVDLGGGGDTDRFTFSQGYVFQRDREIFIADRGDYQNARQLTRSGNNSEPGLSLDGRTVVYVHADESGRTSLRTVTASGGDERELVAASPDRQLSQPAPSREGARVVFVSARGSDSILTVINIDGSGEKDVPRSTRDSSPSFYPDGLSVLALNRLNKFDEFSKVELGSGARSGRAQNLVDTGARAVLSPDGRRVAFEARDKDGRSRIFVVDESGNLASRRQLTDTGGEDTFPTWVGNLRLGFTSDSGGAANLYEVETTPGATGAPRLTVPVAAQGSFGGM